jgi:transcriptional repressor NrdR
MVELRMPQMVKSNGYREEFSEDKLRTGFMRALHKRPVPANLVEDAVVRIKNRLLALGEREVDSRRLGEMVMKELYRLDKVAYIRFASVYKDFQDVDDFRDAIKEVQKPAPRRKGR